MGHYGDYYDAEAELQAKAEKLKIKNFTTKLNQVVLDLSHDKDEKFKVARQHIQTAILWLNSDA